MLPFESLCFECLNPRITHLHRITPYHPGGGAHHQREQQAPHREALQLEMSPGPHLPPRAPFPLGPAVGSFPGVPPHPAAWEFTKPSFHV